MPNKITNISEIEAALSTGITGFIADNMFKSTADGLQELRPEYGYPVENVLQGYDDPAQDDSVLSAQAIINHCAADTDNFVPIYNTKYASGIFAGMSAVKNLETDKIYYGDINAMRLYVLDAVPDGGGLTDFDIIVKIFPTGAENSPTKHLFLTFPKTKVCQFILPAGYNFSFSTTEPIRGSESEFRYFWASRELSGLYPY